MPALLPHPQQVRVAHTSILVAADVWTARYGGPRELTSSAASEDRKESKHIDLNSAPNVDGV